MGLECPRCPGAVCSASDSDSLRSHSDSWLLPGSSGLAVHPQGPVAHHQGASSLHPCQLCSPALRRASEGPKPPPAPQLLRELRIRAVSQRSPPGSTSREAERPETLSQCSFLDHQLPARTSAHPLSLCSSCRLSDNLRCFLCRSLPTQISFLVVGQSLPSRACETWGAQGGGRSPPHLSVLLLPCCLCVCPPSLLPRPHPLSLSLAGATLSHSLVLCRWT